LSEIGKDNIEELTQKESNYVYESYGFNQFLKEVYNNSLLENVIYNSKLLYNYIDLVKKGIHLYSYIDSIIVEKGIDGE
jgi:hypothetical protein